MKCEFPAKKRGAEQPAKGAKGEATSCKGEEDDEFHPSDHHDDDDEHEHNRDEKSAKGAKGEGYSCKGEEDVDVDPGGDHHDDEHLQSHDYDDQSVKTFMIMMVSQSRP